MKNTIIMIVLAYCINLSVYASETVQKSELISSLSTHSKLSSNINLLDLFNSNNEIVKVVVSLKPSDEAIALSNKAIEQNSERFSASDSPEISSKQGQMYYDLSDRSTREQLANNVANVITSFTNQIQSINTNSQNIGEGQATPITITNTFDYSFGFAADVTPEGLQFLLQHKDVLLVEENLILKPHLNQGITVMNGASSRTDYNGSGLSVAIVDTGIDDSHPDLDGGKVLGGYDFGDNDANFRPTSTGDAHGTAVAGIVAGDINTVGDYIGGVAPGAKLYGLKISPGNTGSATSAAMINAWEWAITHKDDDVNNPILIVNTSFGGGRYTSICDTTNSAMTQAALNSVNAGITHFVSSGNDGYCDSMGWPACISHVNSVGAVYDANIGQRGTCLSTNSCLTTTAHSACPSGTGAYFESTAADKVTSYSNSAPNLTIFAPSNNAYTTDITGSGGYSSGDYAATFGGTSAAAPYSSGAAAVLQSAAKAKLGRFLTPSEVKSFFTTTGNMITDSKIAISKPRINLGSAVAALMSPPSGEEGEMCVPVKATNGKVVVLCL